MITPLTNLREKFVKNKVGALLVSSVPNIIYLTQYSGFSKEEREVYLFITQNEQYILTDGRYTTAVKTLIPDFKLIEISPNNSAKDILKILRIKHKVKKLAIEENDLKVSEHKKFSSHSNDMYHYSGIHSLRSIKSKDEVAKIESACKLGDKTFDYILKKIRLGLSEKELATEMEFFIKRQGGDISFKPIIAFGKNSAIPHHVSTHSSKLLTHNSIILLDFGVRLNNYCSDMTRTVFFGKPTPEQKKIYQTVSKAQQKAISFLSSTFNHLPSDKKQIKALQVDKTARDYIISQGYSSIPHSLGHGIGIAVHELPRISPDSNDILKEGMVFSIEPGIYLPAEASAKEGIPNFGGVRIEDLVVLEKGGLRLLTHSPKDIIEL